MALTHGLEIKSKPRNLKRKNTETYVLVVKVVNFAKNTVYYNANPAAPIIQRQSNI